MLACLQSLGVIHVCTTLEAAEVKLWLVFLVNFFSAFVALLQDLVLLSLCDLCLAKILVR